MISRTVARVSQADRGAILMEYAMLFMLVIVVAIMAMAAVGVSVVDLYTSNADRFEAAVRPSVG